MNQENIEILIHQILTDKFGLWLAVIFGIITLVMGINIYNSFTSKKEVKEELNNYKKTIDSYSNLIKKYENELSRVETLESRLQKSYESNNLLSSVILHITEKNYSFALDCIKYLFSLDSNNILYKYYYAKCLFLDVLNQTEDKEDEISWEIAEQASASIKMYFEIQDTISEEQQNIYNLGWIYPNSNEHELCYLANILLNSEHSEIYFYLVREVLNKMKTKMHVMKTSDFAFVDFSDTTFLQYKDLLKKLGIKMLKSGNNYGNVILNEYFEISDYSKCYLDTLNNDDIFDVISVAINYNKYNETIIKKFNEFQERIKKEIDNNERRNFG